MHVKSIKLINFRNYNGIKVFLNPNVNIFLGENGEGKTNLLESLFIASSGKSFRTNRDKELINIDKNEAYIAVELIREDSEKKIEIKLDNNSPKRVKINGVEQDKISDILGILKAVIFSPEDLKIVKEGPSYRRNFLDQEITQMKPLYKSILNDYNRVLTQRNNLLKVIPYDKKKRKMLFVWNKQLIELGSRIIIFRKSFIDRLIPIAQEIHKSVTNGVENLDLSYQPTFDINELDKKIIMKNFEELLIKNEDSDIEKGSTSLGPHKDDIEIKINDKDVRIFGSQGQKRTTVLSLKLAEVELIKDETDENPILLLDDVFSELDKNRRKYLVSRFSKLQTIITTNDDINDLEVDKINKKTYYIKDGDILYSK
ncbi:MAG: DNA replication/repair protein RecF [Senegalia sp. (in: firmicutes)]